MRRVFGLFLPLSLAALGCGEDAIDPLTGGEGSGSTGFDVIVTDDPASDPAPAPARGSRGLEAISGDFDGSIRVALRSEAGALVDLGVMQDALVELQQGSDSLTLEDLTRPPADNYVGVQLRFEGVTVTVFEGSEVGDTTLANDVVLDIGNAGLATIEIATVPFDVDSETDMSVVVDLNSELWVTSVNVEGAVVPQTNLANNVTVEIL